MAPFNAVMRTRLSHLEQFYCLLATLESRLGGARRLSECTGRMAWPGRGVYFFMERGEDRSDSGQGPRVVRVGTHALHAGAKSKLWGRLSQHRGPKSSGGGSHRGSVFRLIVGTAIIRRDSSLDYPAWGRGNSAPREIRQRELPLERAVSKVIGEMTLLWLPVEDSPGPDSLRGYIERNLIALLSDYGEHGLDVASESWLGRHCAREKVRRSGLWNSNHVHEEYDPAFLDEMARLVDQVGSAA